MNLNPIATKPRPGGSLGVVNPEHQIEKSILVIILDSLVHLKIVICSDCYSSVGGFSLLWIEYRERGTGPLVDTGCQCSGISPLSSLAIEKPFVNLWL